MGPEGTVDLVRDLCGLRAGAAIPTELQNELKVDDFLPIFADDLHQLECFLRGLLLSNPGNVSATPPDTKERLFSTFLELLVRSHLQLTEKTSAGDGSAAVEEELEKKGQEIMRLIKQHPTEEALASTLMLCRTYGFVDGFFHAAEHLSRHQLMVNWCVENKDAKRLLQICKQCGSVDQSLWVQ